MARGICGGNQNMNIFDEYFKIDFSRRVLIFDDSLYYTLKLTITCIFMLSAADLSPQDFTYSICPLNISFLGQVKKKIFILCFCFA